MGTSFAAYASQFLNSGGVNTGGVEPLFYSFTTSEGSGGMDLDMDDPHLGSGGWLAQEEEEESGNSLLQGRSLDLHLVYLHLSLLSPRPPFPFLNPPPPYHQLSHPAHLPLRRRLLSAHPLSPLLGAPGDAPQRPRHPRVIGCLFHMGGPRYPSAVPLPSAVGALRVPGAPPLHPLPRLSPPPRAHHTHPRPALPLHLPPLHPHPPPPPPPPQPPPPPLLPPRLHPPRPRRLHRPNTPIPLRSSGVGVVLGRHPRRPQGHHRRSRRRVVFRCSVGTETTCSVGKGEGMGVHPVPTLPLPPAPPRRPHTRGTYIPRVRRALRSPRNSSLRRFIPHTSRPPASVPYPSPAPRTPPPPPLPPLSPRLPLPPPPLLLSPDLHRPHRRNIPG
ncbi:hypothetical protein EV368DRAFT_87956 [Lentinula lateritia]|nr:hypothetical protein EV368DRAFT_87956 [Lentinula lateritia]